MLRRMRGVRFSMKTTVIVIALALVVWAIVVVVQVRDFVPDELTAPVEQAAPGGDGGRGS